LSLVLQQAESIDQTKGHPKKKKKKKKKSRLRYWLATETHARARAFCAASKRSRCGSWQAGSRFPNIRHYES
jgi:hypothetical protein